MSLFVHFFMGGFPYEKVKIDNYTLLQNKVDPRNRVFILYPDQMKMQMWMLFLVGKPKISRKTFYYESVQSKHVGKMGCRDEKTKFFQKHSGDSSLFLLTNKIS